MDKHPFQPSQRDYGRIKTGMRALGRRRNPLGQSVGVAKGINDCPYIMKKLVQDLLKIRIRPYYLYQCDLSLGLAAFRTPG